MTTETAGQRVRRLEPLRASRDPAICVRSRDRDHVAFRILVAEDDPLLRRVLGDQLTRLGYRCDVVADGRSALERWLERPYRLLITDCAMPGLDGYELVRTIRWLGMKSNRYVPVIALTGAGSRERCLCAGMDDFLQKPVKLEALASKIDAWKEATEDGGWPV